MSLKEIPRSFVRKLIPLSPAEIPKGYMFELAGRGSTYVSDTPGPVGAPTLLLLHAVGCTGLLTWFPAIAPLTEHFRVITLDQRWHGQGIQSEEFSLHDCADDAAALIQGLGLTDVIVVGYSMGSIVAQRTWRQHPELVGGLVLCATTDRFQTSPSEMAFFRCMEISMALLRGLARSRTARAAARTAARALELDQLGDVHDWALKEFRKTSPWAVAQAVAALGRHHSTPWLPRINVPTSVVLTCRDKVLPPERQRALAERIPGATVHEVDRGHAACVLASDEFVPVLLDACLATAARLRSRQLG